MRLSIFLLIMALLMLLGFICFFGLIFSFDPFQASKIIVILAYLTFFFGLTGLLSLIIFWARKKLEKEQDTEKIFWLGVALSLIIVGGLAVLVNV